MLANENSFLVTKHTLIIYVLSVTIPMTPDAIKTRLENQAEKRGGKISE